MSPLIKQGDFLVARKSTAVGFFSIGIYRRQNSFVAHRFLFKIKIKGEWLFLFKADTKFTPELIKEKDVIGEVIRVIRKKRIEIGPKILFLSRLAVPFYFIWPVFYYILRGVKYVYRPY